MELRRQATLRDRAAVPRSAGPLRGGGEAGGGQFSDGRAAERRAAGGRPGGGRGPLRPPGGSYGPPEQRRSASIRGLWAGSGRGGGGVRFGCRVSGGWTAHRAVGRIRGISSSRHRDKVPVGGMVQQRRGEGDSSLRQPGRSRLAPGDEPPDGIPGPFAGPQGPGSRVRCGDRSGSRPLFCGHPDAGRLHGGLAATGGGSR